MEIKKVIKMLIEDIKRNGFYNPANEHFLETPLLDESNYKEEEFVNYLTDFLTEKGKELNFSFTISFEAAEKVTFKEWLEGKGHCINTIITILNKENDKIIITFPVWEEYYWRESNACDRWLAENGYVSYRDYLKAENIL